jgi:outer membrane receptor for ferric coprogen and ferric-rhodotorulic acid
MEPERCFSVSDFPLNVQPVNLQTISAHKSRHGRLRPVTATLAAIILILTALPAFAALGEDAGSVQADQARMQASLRTTQAQAYTVQEIQAPTGIIIREYISPATGKVFAVAWQGPWPPNMQQILASYFDQFQQAAQAQAGTARAIRRPLMISLPGLVVQSGGHMRSFSGRAYVPDMLPQGVTAEAIR